jgi:uncharacterized lipoprotein YbaY
MSHDRPLLRGIIFCEEGQAFERATVYVRLEDVSRADGPADVVAEQVIPNVSYQEAHAVGLRFSLPGELLDERASYAVRVHVDVNRDGRVNRGDYLSMESYPVLTHGYPDRVTVRVREVR